MVAEARAVELQVLRDFREQRTRVSKEMVEGKEVIRVPEFLDLVTPPKDEEREVRNGIQAFR